MNKKYKIKTERSGLMSSPKNKEFDANEDLVKKLTESFKQQSKEIDKL